MRAIAILILFCLPDCVSAQADATPLDPADADIKKWVEQLGSPRFEVREQATQRLIEAGPAVIDSLTEGVAGGGVESSFRGLEVLRELALQDNGDAIRAEQALQQLATNQATASAYRAEVVLQSLRAVRTSQALKILRRLGATISFTGETYEERSLGQRVVYITLGKNWKGNTKDLEFVGWLSDYQGIHITLRGPAFDDSSLPYVADLTSLVSLQLNRTSMTDKGIAHIERMSSLRVLSIRYCKLTNECLKHFDKLEQRLTSFSVFGSGISKPAFDKLVAKHTTWNTRYGRGGFLGIGGTAFQLNGIEGCIVSQVTPNEAASTADIRRDDVITAYNGLRVTQFIPDNRDFPQIEPTESEKKLPAPSLSELIGENAPGDSVKVTILRGDRELVKDVVLGEWP